MAKNALLSQDPTAYKIAQFLVNGGALPDIAQKLGITEHAARLCMRKHNAKEIYLSLYAERLMFDLAPQSLKVMSEVLHGKQKPNDALIGLCKTIMDRIGMGAAKPIANEQPGAKPVESMSIAELQAFIADKEAGLKDITPHNAPGLAPAIPQAFDYLDD